MWHNIWYDLLLDVPELELMTDEQQTFIKETLKAAYDRGFDDGSSENGW